MSTLTVPTRTDLGAYTFQVELDSLVYRFAFQFNDREGFWYLSIADESGVAIRSGIKVVVNTPLFRLIASEDAPPGELLAIDTTNADNEPGLTDLGESVLLTYVEEASLS